MRTEFALDRVVFAAGPIGLGVLTLVSGDFALQWQPVPAWVPGRELLAYLSGALLLYVGAGILGSRTAPRASAVLLVYVVLWFALLKLPRALAAPLVEINWNGVGETALILLGAWATFASLRAAPTAARSSRLAGDGARHAARWLFGLALIPIGLSHFVYFNATLGFVPAWLPFRPACVYLAGACHLAAGIAMVVGVIPHVAARAEAAMIGVFTLLVWVPHVAIAPGDRLQWTALLMSWAIGAGAWVAAGRAAPLRRRRPLEADEMLQRLNEEVLVAR